MALGGLIYQRTEAQKQGIPVLGDVPYLGAAFRTVREEFNELELLVMVTPEFVDAMDPEEVPDCGPGQSTESPCDKDLYLKGFIEVPKGYGVSCNGKNCTPHARLRGGRCETGNCDAPSSSNQISSPYETIDPGVRQPQAPIGMQSRTIKPSKTKATTSQVSTARRSNPQTQDRSVIRRNTTSRQASSSSGGPELIGPVGYDVLK
jgi:pilus assembly protein CpaC